MKIGILTYHRTNNYGAVLQAVALRIFLERHGHKVYYIDYWPDYHKNAYSLFNKKAFKSANIYKKIILVLKFILNFYGAKKRIGAFTPFLEKYIIPFCKPYLSDDEYDVIIYGSDQIWRKQAGMGKKFNPVYFGKNMLKARKHIAYAASMGRIELDGDDKIFLSNSLSKFDFVGVREQDLFDTLNSLDIPKLQLVIDPTLLLTSDDWDKILPTKPIINEKYVLLYQIAPSFNRFYAEQFAKSKGLKLVVLSSIYDWKHPNDIIGTPFDFISLIKNAEYVLAGSFHGVAFSVNYSKQVFASFKDNSNRVETLFSLIGVKNHLFPVNSHLPSDVCYIDYTKTRRCLDKSRKSCGELLLSHLEFC